MKKKPDFFELGMACVWAGLSVYLCGGPYAWASVAYGVLCGIRLERFFRSLDK